MKIERISDNKYLLSQVNNIEIISNLFDLFNLNKIKKEEDSLEILDIDHIETFKNWKENLNHPKIDFLLAELLFKNFAAISLYLEKNKLQFSNLSIDNLIVIDKKFFIPTNIEDLYSIKDNMIEIIKPYNKSNLYLPIELKENSSIPLKINFKVFYYSFSLLIYDLLIGLEQSNFQEGLLVIYMTKLYWLLLNCLTEKTEDRYIINL